MPFSSDITSVSVGKFAEDDDSLSFKTIFPLVSVVVKNCWLSFFIVFLICSLKFLSTLFSSVSIFLSILFKTSAAISSSVSKTEFIKSFAEFEIMSSVTSSSLALNACFAFSSISLFTLFSAAISAAVFG